MLSYRGLRYKSTTTHFATIDSGITAKYRGLTYRVQQRVAVPAIPYELQYRGVAYYGTRFV